MRVTMHEDFAKCVKRHLSDGGCTDCGQPMSVYEVDIGEGPNIAVVHHGNACQGFVGRFDAAIAEKRGRDPSPTIALTGDGHVVNVPVPPPVKVLPKGALPQDVSPTGE